MADEMRAFDAELGAQGFEVGDKPSSPKGWSARNRHGRRS
jgi:hypothetical protein